MKTTLWLAVLVLAGCSSGHLYQSEDGKFSYTVPEGWTMREFPGQKYQIAFGTGGDGFSPNITIVSEEFDGPLEVYVEGNKTTIQRMFPNFQLVGEGLFDTASGVKGFKLVGKASQMGIPLEQAWYFLPGKGEYFVVTGSALDRNFASFEADFDRALKSFSLR